MGFRVFIIHFALLFLSVSSAYCDYPASDCPQFFEQLSSLLKPSASREGSRIAFISEAARMVENAQSFSLQRYGKEGPKLLKRLEKLNPHFAALIVDPGLVLRLDQFEKFVKQNHYSKLDPWELRRLFSKSLGSRRVYRALSLSEEEVEQMKTMGMKSKLINVFDDYVKDKNPKWVNYELNANLNKQVIDRAAYPAAYDSLLSVTEMPEVGIAVSKRYLEANKNVYLFELEVPELDILYQKQKGLLDYAEGANRYYLRLTRGSHVEEYPYADRKTESFILYQVNASEIKSVKKIAPEEIPSLDWAEKIEKDDKEKK